MAGSVGLLPTNGLGKQNGNSDGQSLSRPQMITQPAPPKNSPVAAPLGDGGHPLVGLGAQKFGVEAFEQMPLLSAQSLSEVQPLYGEVDGGGAVLSHVVPLHSSPEGHASSSEASAMPSQSVSAPSQRSVVGSTAPEHAAH